MKKEELHFTMQRLDQKEADKVLNLELMTRIPHNVPNFYYKGDFKSTSLINNRTLLCILLCLLRL